MKRPEPERLPDGLSDTSGTDPAKEVLAGELAERVAGAVSRLPPRQREVLVLIAYEGLSTAEAAVALYATAQNQRTTLHRAREQLRV